MITTDFSIALRNIKAGYRMRRTGWNGKGMWLTLSPGGFISSDKFWAENNRLFAEKSGGGAIVRPYITMKTADNEIVPWVASQSDLLADDWEIVATWE